LPAGTGQSASERNLVRLTATVLDRDALRHTPAGVPLMNLTLQHESTQLEAKLCRAVQATVEAVALGDLAQQMDRLTVGQMISVKGFLANRSRRSTRLVLHVNEFDTQ
jgi:primosomal replication protein N